MNNILTKEDILYKDKLAMEWMEWVETSNPEGSREKDLFPEVLNWLMATDPKSILDIGCGQGIMSTLVSENIDYTGVDISKELINRANIKYTSEKRKFAVGDAYNLPFENEKFDAIMSFWVWSHLENPAKAAKEMARVLKPEGHFIVVTANPQTYDIRRSFYSTYEEKDGLIVGDFDLGNGKKLSQTTLYLHTLQDFIKAIDNAGLTIDKNNKIGMLDHYPDGLYVVLSGKKN